MKKIWIKPEYCEKRNVNCDVCEYYRNELCDLNENYRKILDDVLKEEETHGKRPVEGNTTNKNGV